MIGSINLGVSEILEMELSNADVYHALKTEMGNVGEWWDSLTNDEKWQVANVAFHYNLFSSNYVWVYNNDYGGKCNWDNIKNGQKDKIKSVWNVRNHKWSMFPNMPISGFFGDDETIKPNKYLGKNFSH